MQRKLLPVLALSLILLSCSPSQITMTLKGVLLAARIALPLLGGSLDPSIQQQISTYLSAVSDGVAQATEILATTDSPQVKAAKLAQVFAAIARPTLPFGTAQAVLSIISGVANAVEHFLIASGANAHTNGLMAVPIPAVNAGDRQSLPHLRAGAAELKRQVRQNMRLAPLRRIQE